MAFFDTIKMAFRCTKMSGILARNAGKTANPHMSHGCAVNSLKTAKKQGPAMGRMRNNVGVFIRPPRADSPFLSWPTTST